GRTSFRMSVFNLSNAIMGSGILGLSYALANTGIILFVLILVSVTILALYSIHLLLLCSKKTECMVYEDLGYKAFGITGKCAVFGSTFLQNIGAILSYMFIVKNELPLVLQFLTGFDTKDESWYMNGDYLVIMVTVAIILPLCLLKSLGEHLYDIILHKTFLNMTARTSKKMEHVSIVSFLSMFFMYILTAFFGYFTFYDKVNEDLLRTYDASHDVLILVVRLAVVTAVILTVPVLFFVVSPQISFGAD
ncbi:UNVERIFIED_CONTAM: hypothetical protein FKN15_069945, partial [Acipenser sinensis]